MTKLKDGHLIVLPREEAKSYFSCRTDDARLEFVQQRLVSKTAETLNCEGIWEPLQRALTNAAPSDSVLSQCLLGGRPMHLGDSHVVLMVRPDVVGQIADELESLTEADLRQRWDAVSDAGEGGDLAWSITTGMAQLYRRAADTGGAVVFCAQSRPRAEH